jgi:hypothetical protein
LPKAMLVALMLRVAGAGLSCSEKVLETLLALAVNVTVCAVLTAEAVAEKLAVVAPAMTVTEDGTETDELLLARFTVEPPVAAAVFSVTVQASVPAPVIEELVHERPLSTGTPVPLKATLVDVPVEELLDSVSCPVAEPAAEGSN